MGDHMSSCYGICITYICIVYMCTYRNVTGPNAYQLTIVKVYDMHGCIIWQFKAILVIVRLTAVVHTHVVCL